jgi:hypothetical protein
MSATLREEKTQLSYAFQYIMDTFKSIYQAVGNLFTYKFWSNLPSSIYNLFVSKKADKAVVVKQEVDLKTTAVVAEAPPSLSPNDPQLIVTLDKAKNEVAEVNPGSYTAVLVEEANPASYTAVLVEEECIVDENQEIHHDSKDCLAPQTKLERNNEEVVSRKASERKSMHGFGIMSISAIIMLLALFSSKTTKSLFYSIASNEGENTLNTLKDLKTSQNLETFKTLQDLETLLHAECTRENARTQNPFSETGRSFWKNCNEVIYPDREAWESVEFKWRLRNTNIKFKNRGDAGQYVLESDIPHPSLGINFN